MSGTEDEDLEKVDADQVIENDVLPREWRDLTIRGRVWRRECALERCGRPFLATNAGVLFCSKLHALAASEDRHRDELRAKHKARYERLKAMAEGLRAAEEADAARLVEAARAKH
jgi:hypothetical protein